MDPSKDAVRGGLTFAAVAALSFVVAAGPAGAQGRIAWETDFAAALQRAKAEGNG